MRSIRRGFQALVLLACLNGMPVHATSFSTDQSDLWYIANESGWGMQLVQQNSTMFATLFVYGSNGAPTWYVATLAPTGTPLVWSGTLFATTGPWFGAPFNAAAVSANPVGTMTWTGVSVESGNVVYTVNGVTVSKNVIRQNLATDNYSGTFAGAIHGTTTSCSNPAFNEVFEGYAAFSVSQNGSSVSIGYASSALGVTCGFSGSYSQTGQFGKVLGSYSCDNGEVGSFNFFEMNVGFNYLTARLSLNGTNTGCQTTGYIAGARHR